MLIVEYFGSSAASVVSAENAERTAREEATALVNTYLAKCQEAGVSVECWSKKDSIVCSLVVLFKYS